MTKPDFLYRARWIFPMIGAPLENGAVVIHRGRITKIAPFTKDLANGLSVHDAGDVALLPALINAHTHLDLSEIPQPLGTPGTPLHEWIPSVMASRTDAPHSKVTTGIEELTTTGTVAFADFTQSEQDAETLETATRYGWSLRELIGPTYAKFDSVLQLATDFLTPKREGTSHANDYSSSNYNDLNMPRIRRGLAPHATYTVPLPLLERIVAIAVRSRAMVAMHVAESPEESRFLDSQTGPLRSMLEKIGVSDLSAFPAHTTCYDLLTILAQAERSLVIHGNFLDDDSIRYAADHRDRMAVVHCPRSFRHFGYDVPIVRKLRQAGARVVLGTDGRSSTPSLNLMEELAELLQVYPEIPLTESLRMVTLDAAKSLGIDAWCGSLSPGRIAKFVALPVENQSIVIPSTGMIVPFR